MVINMNEKIRDDLVQLCIEGLRTTGVSHKQWYLEEILKMLEPTADEVWNTCWEKGIPG